ncbi:Cell adhesion molecule 3 [Microtus ochrogaster]|uniref:Cell adhesion molecule 3 n=1 Tax=Microtus ochrogaster TaxID=79684 RepID=A0A8J6GM22_MICOH|nr:Cell adhesion molecule 3 [Microtus ochrogaster]
MGRVDFRGRDTSAKRSFCLHTGTYLTHEAKGSDDAPDADTAIINAEGGQSGGDDKKEYFI